MPPLTFTSRPAGRGRARLGRLETAHARLGEDLAPVEEDAPLARPSWWRWVAVVVVIAMVVATPFAFVLYRVLH